MAATIGGIESGGVFSGQVDLIDLLAASQVVNPVPIVSSSTFFAGCVPLDLAMAFNQSEVVVRSSAYVAEGPSTPGPDLVRIVLTTGAFFLTYGGNGVQMGLDSLAVPSLTGFIHTGRKMLSISEDQINQRDFVHLAR